MVTSSITNTVYDETIERLRLAGEQHDHGAMVALLADAVIVRSPITDRIRFEGIDQARDLFERVFAVISDIRFYEVVGSGTSTQVIFWRGIVGGRPLEEANLLQIDDHGRITEMTVFMRTIPGLLQLVAELAPSLASRHSRTKAMIIRALLVVFSKMYALAEPIVLRLVGAGAAVPNRAEELARMPR